MSNGKTGEMNDALMIDWMKFGTDYLYTYRRDEFIFFSSYFWPILIEKGAKAVEKWTDRLPKSLFDYQIAFLPVHLKKKHHWALCCVSFFAPNPDSNCPSAVIFMMDSLLPSPPPQSG